MKAFTALYTALDQTNSTNDKQRAMVEYLEAVPPHDAAWALWFLSGHRLKRLVKRADLRAWVLAETGYPEWLLDETYQAVGDMAETIALLLPEPGPVQLDDLALHVWVEQRLSDLGGLDSAEQGARVRGWWQGLPGPGRFVLNKLLTGALRVGVSQRLVVRALAEHLQVDAAVVAHRLMGDWQPGPDLLDRVRDGGDGLDAALPYPFFLAAPLQDDPDRLGPVADWQAEWKWDGIRAQVIRRAGGLYLWSRGEERLDGRFPEVEAACTGLPDGAVLDGELLGRDGEDGPFRFAALQRRIGRLRPGRRLLQEVPVVFMAYDLLEVDGMDLRPAPLSERRSRLEALLVEHPQVLLSGVVAADDWRGYAGLRAQSRERGVEGLMLKRRAAPYGVGRRRGDWWKWKVDPLTIDAVLIYAQPGSGRRSNQLTDYTFAVWRGEDLVPVCKAYSGLSNAEIRELDRWLRQHTVERFGPVRSVEPLQVFEIAFEGVQRSSRHKSGVAFRFPRMARWRRDLGPQDADTLEEVLTLV